jgi:DNA (cytosine-5)-methyltransferase 1
MVAFGEYECDDSASTLKMRDYKDATDLVAHTLRGEGFDASEDGTGRGTPLVPISFYSNESYCDNIQTDGSSVPIKIGSGGSSGNPPAVAFAQNTRDELREMQVVGALAAEPGMKQTSYIRQQMQVRRLTPRECERLQGFPDDHTLVPWRGKTAPDGPRYKALGNSMAVPVMRWIGQRIADLNRDHPTTPNPPTYEKDTGTATDGILSPLGTAGADPGMEACAPLPDSGGGRVLLHLLDDLAHGEGLAGLPD